MLIPFATQSYQSTSLPVSAQRCVNLYAEKEPPESKTPVAVLAAPGLTSFAVCGSGPVRGLHVMNGLLYVVSGPSFFSVSSLGVTTFIGTGISGSGFVGMADNGAQLMIVNGAAGYVYTLSTNLLTPVTDPNFHPANTVTFFDNVFVFDWIGTNKFFISNTLDGTTYNGLAFGTAEVSSDFVQTTVNQQETLLIFGGSTVETWYDAGAPILPFLRVDGGTVERGCSAPQSIVKEDNSVFFLGDDLIYYRLNGVAPMRVSTHAIEDAWRQYGTVTDAFAFSYTFEGHKFVAITFPTANASWHFDIATGLWHERDSWDAMGNSYGRWRGNCHATCYGLELIGDFFTGQIGILDRNNYTEFGNTIRGLAVSPPIHSDRKRLFLSRFELDVETGVGIASGQGSDPQIMLEWSRDGGRTFSGLQIWQSIGKAGAYLQRLRWLRLGQARQWVFRVTVTDPVRRTIMAANADISQGM